MATSTTKEAPLSLSSKAGDSSHPLSTGPCQISRILSLRYLDGVLWKAPCVIVKALNFTLMWTATQCSCSPKWDTEERLDSLNRRANCHVLYHLEKVYKIIWNFQIEDICVVQSGKNQCPDHRYLRIPWKKVQEYL